MSAEQGWQVRSEPLPLVVAELEFHRFAMMPQDHSRRSLATIALPRYGVQSLHFSLRWGLVALSSFSSSLRLAFCELC